MAKVSGPLLSLSASGQIGNAMVFATWKGVQYVRQLVTPTYTNTTTQAAIRLLVKDASEAWKTNALVGAVQIDAAYKLAYATAAAGTAMSGFNLFIKQCVALNSGSAYDSSLAIPASPTA